MSHEKEYDGWLVSTNIFKRAFAVVGHYLLGMLMVWSIILILMLSFMAFGLMFGLVLN